MSIVQDNLGIFVLVSWHDFGVFCEIWVVQLTCIYPIKHDPETENFGLVVNSTKALNIADFLKSSLEFLIDVCSRK